MDAFWDIFSIHSAKPALDAAQASSVANTEKQEVYDILEDYRIGSIDPQGTLASSPQQTSLSARADLIDGRVPQTAVSDPFSNDPTRDPALKQHTTKPCNAETPAELLNTFVTPTEHHYVRNHMVRMPLLSSAPALKRSAQWCPRIDDPDSYAITVELYNGDERMYTLAELKRLFRPYTITATLQCSGNRRSHMTLHSRGTQGLQWSVGAIGTATWTGVKLRDVLAHAGMDVNEPDVDARHACFSGKEAYGASVPLDKALDPAGDTLLAFEMNGETLPVDHGFPLRVLVPGNVAARSVRPVLSAAHWPV